MLGYSDTGLGAGSTVPNHTPPGQSGAPTTGSSASSSPGGPVNTSSSNTLSLPKKLFDNKQTIKPWLQSQLSPRGINIVIERSDDSKVVFKCRPIKSVLQYSQPEQRRRPKKETSTASRHKSTCPFRIRANYSMRAKKWSLVIINDQHNHPLVAAPERAQPEPRLPETKLPSMAAFGGFGLSGGLPSGLPSGLSGGLSTGLPSGLSSALRVPTGSTSSSSSTTLSSDTSTPSAKFLPTPPFSEPGTFPDSRRLAAPELLKTSSSSSAMTAGGTGSMTGTNALPGGLSTGNAFSAANSLSTGTANMSLSATTNTSLLGSNTQDCDIQQKLNFLHLQINNLLLCLNTSPSLSDPMKEDTYQRVISILQDALIGKVHVRVPSPTYSYAVGKPQLPSLFSLPALGMGAPIVQSVPPAPLSALKTPRGPPSTGIDVNRFFK